MRARIATDAHRAGSRGLHHSPLPSHHGNNFSVVFQATLSALLKARKIDDADSDEGAPGRANGTDRRPSLLKRLSLKDMIGAGPSSPPSASK